MALGVLPPAFLVVVIAVLLGDSSKSAIAHRPHRGHTDQALQLWPKVWAVLGPGGSRNGDGEDPFAAFGGIHDIVKRAPAALWETMRKRTKAIETPASEKERHSRWQIGESGDASQMPKDLQDKLETFPSEDGHLGRTSWLFATSDFASSSVSVGFATGWAIGEVVVAEPTAVLARCTQPIMVDNGVLAMKPDQYNEHRSVQVLHLTKGTHRIFVPYAQSFWCDFLQDSASAREKVLGTPDRSAGKSPWIVMPDTQISEAVDGYMASPYVAVPILNAGEEALMLRTAEIVDGPKNMVIEAAGPSGPSQRDKVAILPGQSFVLRLELKQTGALSCEKHLNKEGTEVSHTLNLTIRVHPESVDGKKHEAAEVNFITACRPFAAIRSPGVWERGGGYIVTFPDYDGSIQRMWVAPPNVTGLPGGRCPDEGCPIMLSLHGASVIVSTNWGRNYEFAEKGDFPYPAWLVEPSNRYHWGTDWEGPGFDDGFAAMAYVREHLPGAPESVRKNRKADASRMLVTGHSMGGHGCLVFSVHDPDRLLGSACGAPWTNQEHYMGIGAKKAALLDPVGQSYMSARTMEHAADYLAANLRGVPLALFYGDSDDNVPVTEPRYMARLVDSFSGDASAVTVVEIPRTQHWFGQDNPDMVTFFSTHLPSDGSWQLPPLPHSFEWTVVNPATFGTKGNLKLLQLGDASRPGKFFVRRCDSQEASTTERNDPVCSDPAASAALRTPKGRGFPEASHRDPLWHIETFNVRRFHFAKPSSGGVRGRPLPRAVRIDGTLFDASAIEGADGQHFCLARAGGQGLMPAWAICGASEETGRASSAGVVSPRGNRLWESVQRAGPLAGSGPLHMSLRRAPVCIAHGGNPEHKQVALGLANQLYFVSRYAVPIVDTSSPKMKSGAPSYCADANLILIGSPEENAWVAQYRCAFPYIKFHDTGAISAASGGKNQARGFTLGGQAYTGPNIGALAVGTLPATTNRLALLVYGTDARGLGRAARRVPITSQQDGGDFLVLGPDAGWQGEGGLLAAGYLDSTWQVKPSAGSWAEPVHSSSESIFSQEGMGTDGVQDTHCAAQRAALLASDEEIQAFRRLHDEPKKKPVAKMAAVVQSAERGSFTWWTLSAMATFLCAVAFLVCLTRCSGHQQDLCKHGNEKCCGQHADRS